MTIMNNNDNNIYATIDENNGSSICTIPVLKTKHFS